MTRPVAPRVLDLILCQSITFGPNMAVTVNGILHRFGMPKPSGPITANDLKARFALYASVTDIHGSAVVDLRINCVKHDEEKVFHMAMPRLYAKSPREVIGLPIPQIEAIFPHSGDYYVQIVFAGEVLCERRIEVQFS